MNDLARSWSHPLKACNDPRLNSWYIRQMEGVIARNEWDRSDALRNAIYQAGTPPMQSYLRMQMLDTSKPMHVRNTAGSFFFENTPPDERMDEFLGTFVTMHLPDHVAWFQADRLLGDEPDRLLDEAGRLVRGNPALADQIAFSQIVETSRNRASLEARWRLADNLHAGLQNGAAHLTPRSQQRLNDIVRSLRRRQD